MSFFNSLFYLSAFFAPPALCVRDQTRFRKLFCRTSCALFKYCNSAAFFLCVWIKLLDKTETQWYTIIVKEYVIKCVIRPSKIIVCGRGEIMKKIIALIVTVLCCIALFYFCNNGAMRAKTEKYITVENGMSDAAITKLLKEKGIIKSKTVFKIVNKLSKKGYFKSGRTKIRRS